MAISACKKNGHPLTPDNVLFHKDGRRECLTCHRERQKEYRARQALRKQSKAVAVKVEEVKAVDPRVLLCRAEYAKYLKRHGISDQLAAMRSRLASRPTTAEYLEILAPRNEAA